MKLIFAILIGMTLSLSVYAGSKEVPVKTLSKVCKANVVVGLKKDTAELPNKEQSKVRKLLVKNGIIYFNGKTYKSGKNGECFTNKAGDCVRVTKVNTNIYLIRVDHTDKTKAIIHKCK